MVVITPLADTDKRLGASPTRKPGSAVAPKPINLQSQRDVRGTATWGSRPTPLASNAWGSTLLLCPKNDGGSGSPSHVDDRPSSRGSSTSSSSVGSDFLDLPSYALPTAAKRARITEARSGSSQPSRFGDSFTNVLKAPSRNILKKGPASHGKGFSLSMDDFPVLVSKNSQPNSQPGVLEVISSSSDEVEKFLRTKYAYEGGDSEPAAKMTREAQQAQLHCPQVPNILVPPPWLDYWHSPPDHPPDENGMLHTGAPSYDPYNYVERRGSFPVGSSVRHGQCLLNQEAAARQDPGLGGYYPDSYHPHMAADHRVIHQPPHILVKAKADHSDARQKQPILKKDVALLERIQSLNIKARTLRAHNLSKLSSSEESNLPADGVTVVGIPKEQDTEFSGARELGKSAEYHAHRRGTSPRTRHNGSDMDMFSSSSVHRLEEHSTVDSMRGVIMTDAQGDQPFAKNTSQQYSKMSELCAQVVKELQDEEDMKSRLQAKVIAELEDLNMRSSVQSEKSHYAPPEVVYMGYKPKIGGTETNKRDASVDSPSVRGLSAQHAEKLQDVERKSHQKTKAIAKLQLLSRLSSVQNRESNVAVPEADNLHGTQKAGGNGTSKRDISTVSATGSLLPKGVKNAIFSIGPSVASNIAGVSGGSLIHNVMSTAKNTKINGSLDHVKCATETPADTQSAEAKPHEDLSTRNKKSMRDAAAAKPASPPVSGSHKNTSEVACIINSSVVPAQGAPVTGILIGSIILGDISLASVNPEWTAAVTNAQDEEGALDSVTSATPTTPSGNYSIVSKNMKTTKRPDIERYAHKLVNTELHQQNLGDKHKPSSDNSAKSFSEAKCHDKEAPDKFTAAKAKVGVESKAHDATVDHSEPTETVPLPLNTKQPVPVSTWERHRATASQWRHHVEGQRNVGSNYAFKERVARMHDSHRKPASSRVHWVPKYNDDPRSNVQDNGISECLRDSHESSSEMDDNCQGFDSTTQDNIGSKLAQIFVTDSDNEMDLQSGQGNVVMRSEEESFLVWNETEWEYQRVNPEPQHHDQHDGKHLRGRGSSYDTWEPTYGANEARRNVGRHSEYQPVRSSSDAAPDNQWIAAADDRWRLKSGTKSDTKGTKLYQEVGRDGEMDLQGGQDNLNIKLEDENHIIWNKRDWEYQKINSTPHQHGQHGRMQDHRGGHGRYRESGQDGRETTYDANGSRKNVIRDSEYKPVGSSSDAAAGSTNSEITGRKLTQNVGRDGKMDQHRWNMKFEDESLVIWNPRDWEYQPINPAPHRHEQYDRMDDHSGGHGRYQERGRNAEYPTDDTNEASHKGRVGADDRWSMGRPVSSTSGVYRERQYHT